MNGGAGRKLTATLAAAAVAALAAGCAGWPEGADLYVGPEGNDDHDGTTPATAFRTLDRAYVAAAPGDVVGVLPGVHAAEQEIEVDPTHRSEKDVIFEPYGGDGAVFPESLTINAKHIEMRDLRIERLKSLEEGEDLTFRRVKVETAAFAGVRRLTFVDGEVGPNPAGGADDGMFFGEPIPRKVRIEGTRFHDITRPRSTSHSDCIQFTGGIDVTIRRNVFVRCFDHAAIIKGDQGQLTRFRLENNFAQEVTATTSGFNFSVTGTTPCRDCAIVHNSMTGYLRADAPAAGTSVVAGNIHEKMIDVICTNSTRDGWVWDLNAFEQGTRCGRRAIRVRDSNVGYVSRGGLNLRLTPGSEAIDRGDPRWAPSDDIDGHERDVGAAPDLGADEFGSGP